ncbi:MAG: lysozyme [Pseudomonadota bacterium]
MRTGEAGLNLIKGFEGLRMQSYYTPSEQWSVGYGHTGSAHHGMAVSEGQADMLLKQDIEPVERLIDETVMTPLNRNEHDALVSFIFNVGADNFRRSSVLRRLNAGDRLGAADAMEMWSKAHVNGELVKLDALARRRAAEKSLFLMPISAETVIPSSDIRPADECETARLASGRSAKALARITASSELSEQEQAVRSEALFAASRSLAGDPTKMIISRAEERADWGVTAGAALAGLGGLVAVLVGAIILVGLEAPAVASAVGLDEDRMISLFDRLPIWFVGIGAVVIYFIVYVLVKRSVRHDLKLRREEELARYQILD